MKEKTAISLCDKTGIMMEPWAEAGYTCYAIDLQHKVRKATVKYFEGGGKIIYQYGDARYWTPPEGIEIVFVACFPVCTDMAGSGAQDYSNLNARIPKKGIPQLCDGLLLFNSCYQVAKWSGAPFIVENPSGIIPTHFRKADYTFHPWYYGDDYQKLTCLWTGNGFVMPEREYITKAETVTQKIWEMSPGKERADKRSETPKEFARAVFEANVLGAKKNDYQLGFTDGRDKALDWALKNVKLREWVAPDGLRIEIIKDSILSGKTDKELATPSGTSA